MSVSAVERPVSALRQRMLEDMAMRGLQSDTQHEYIRFVRDFAAFLGVNRRPKLTPDRRPKLTLSVVTRADGSARPGGAGRGCAAGASAVG